MSVAVTAGTVREQLLEPALDARARNLEQKRLLLDPSPAIDSAAEHLVVLEELVGSRTAREHLARLQDLTRRLAVSNGWEGHHERAVATTADGLARDLRALELSGAGDAQIAKEQLARTVRGPLRALCTAPPDGLLPLVAAVRALDRVLALTPPAQLLSATVEYQLGRNSFALLRELVAQRYEESAA